MAGLNLSKDKKKLALYDQLLDELVQVSEDPELKARVVEALGPHKTNCITDLVDAIHELDK